MGEAITQMAIYIFQSYEMDLAILACLSDKDSLWSMLASIAQYFPDVSYLEVIVHDWNIHLVRIFSSQVQSDIRISNWGSACAHTESCQSVIGSVNHLEPLCS